MTTPTEETPPSQAILPTIHTPRLTLVPFTPTSLPAALADLHALRAIPSVMRWTRRGTVDADAAESRAWAEDMMRKPSTHDFLVQLSEETADGDAGRVIGVCGVVELPEVGYLVHPEFHGRGLATEAVRGLVEAYWGFVPSRVRREGGGRSGEARHVPKAYDYVMAQIDGTNGGSRRVLEKCGFQKMKAYRDGAIDVEEWAIARPGTVLEKVFEVQVAPVAGVV